MSSWYLLTSMGLYQICPGKPEFSLTAPLFEEVVVEPEGGPSLRIAAPGASRNRRFAGSVTYRGAPIAGRSIDFGRLRDGGELAVTMHRLP
jgi:putative alpha-1,2-mannosidase